MHQLEARNNRIYEFSEVSFGKKSQDLNSRNPWVWPSYVIRVGTFNYQIISQEIGKIKPKSLPKEKKLSPES